MGKQKPSRAEKAAKKKKAREAFGKANGSTSTTALCPDFRAALSDALQTNRPAVLEATGLPFNILARIATGAQPAQPNQAACIHGAAEVIGWIPPTNG